jgi:hypothetical protein
MTRSAQSPRWTTSTPAPPPTPPFSPTPTIPALPHPTPPAISLSLSLRRPPARLPPFRSDRRGRAPIRRHSGSRPHPLARRCRGRGLLRASLGVHAAARGGRSGSLSLGLADGGAAGEGPGRLRLPHQAAPHRRQRSVASNAPTNPSLLPLSINFTRSG